MGTMNIIAPVVGLLPAAWQPYAKAILPSAITLVGVASEWVITGSFDQEELTTAVTGLVAAVIVFLTPNKPAKP
jgi:hypothetical protein